MDKTSPVQVALAIMETHLYAGQKTCAAWHHEGKCVEKCSEWSRCMVECRNLAHESGTAEKAV